MSNAICFHNFEFYLLSAIQTAVFYQKKMYKMLSPNFLMFLDLKVSCTHKAQEKLTI